MTIENIRKYLGLKDNRSALSWLKVNGLNTKVVGGKKVVSKWLFELKTNELLARELIESYPQNWFELFKAKNDDEKIIKSIKLIIDETPPPTRTKRNKKELNKYIK